jgi:hypothetical protein
MGSASLFRSHAVGWRWATVAGFGLRVKRSSRQRLLRTYAKWQAGHHHSGCRFRSLWVARVSTRIRLLTSAMPSASMVTFIEPVGTPAAR